MSTSKRANVQPRGTVGGVLARSDHSSLPTTINFGEFRLDLRRGQLFRGREPVRLRPKTWGVLQHLAERPGELVSKQEILDAVWPEISVTEEVVRKSINELRAVLGDNSKKPRLIETVPRRGFRFIAPVSLEGSGLDTPDSAVRTQRLLPSAPFVGRDKELQRLTAGLEMASGRARQCVFVTGEAGIGKTALVRAFLDSPAVRAAEVPVWTVHGACIEQHGTHEAYLPVLAALERLVRPQGAGRLNEVLRRVAPTWLAQMPGLIGDDDEKALRQSLQHVRPERMLREFAAFIEALTSDVTLVLVLEDLHWSDASTVDLLGFLAQRSDPARLLVIGTFRPAEAIVREHVLMSLVRTLALRRQCVELPLSDLEEKEVLRYLEARFPGSQLRSALARSIHRHTDGNPLFMIGVVDHLLSRGDILETASGWALRAPLETITLGVPDDVRLLIENDLERLSPADRALLQAASVAGHNFTGRVVAAALDREVTDVEMCCEALARAQRFLRSAGHHQWPDRGVAQRYAFAHELYRQAVYAQITEGQRMRLHHRIGEALEAAYGARQMEIAAQLATHFEHSRDEARALRYLRAAAEHARLRFANREAEAYLHRALGMLARLPEDDTRRRQELDLRLELGSVVTDLHGFASEQLRENCERAAELCVKVGSVRELFRVRYAEWYVHAIRAERDATIATVAELARMARRLRTTEHRTVAASTKVRTAFYDGEFAKAVRLMERRLPRLRVPKEAPAFAVDPVMAGTAHGAMAMWFVGHPQRAQATANAVVACARNLGHFFTLAAILMQAALVELLCGNTAEGGALAAESAAFSAEHGFQFWKAVDSILLGWALVQQGNVSEGIAAIEEAIGNLQSTGTRVFLGYAYGFLADGYRRAGALADALAAVEAGLMVTETSLDRGYAPELWRLEGELIQEQWKLQSPKLRARNAGGESKRAITARAEACFQRALELARGSQAKSLELRAATSQARLWHACGRTAEARKLLSGVCRWFGARATSPDLVEARALLGQLPRSSAARP